MKHLKVISKDYEHLPEKGEAIRVDEEGNILARFIDGNLDSKIIAFPSVDDGPTLPPVA